jgi:DNA replication protein DnaC
VFFGNYSAECADCGRARRAAKFLTICPPLYQKTEASRLPAAQLTKAMEWQYSPRGLILLGETGKGKSRVAWTLLKRVLVEDKKELSFMWFDAIGFGHDIAKHYRDEDAEAWLDKVAACQLVFFDDLGKLKLTERAEVELFGVIERRCAAELPLIVTTNDTGDSLAARMTDNRGPAMIRRLREFCEPIQF